MLALKLGISLNNIKVAGGGIDITQRERINRGIIILSIISYSWIASVIVIISELFYDFLINIIVIILIILEFQLHLLHF